MPSRHSCAGRPDLPRPGRWLAVDVGSVRVGVAQSDPEGILATPVRTIDRDLTAAATDRHSIAALAMDIEATLIMVGLPRSLRGDDGTAAAIARDFARGLARLVAPIRVRLVDERLTTVQSHRQLQASGRREREHREVVDQVAAVLILQGALDATRLTGRVPGELVDMSGRKPRQKERG